MATETEDLTKRLEAAITRISTLEGELRAKPKAQEAPAAPAFDLVKFRSALVMDPIGTLQALQVPSDHVEYLRTALIADKLGDKADMSMRMFLSQGPQMMAAQSTAESVAALSRRLDDQDKQKEAAAKRESFKTIIANKEKYPNLSKAAAADPDLIAEAEKHGGTAEEYAASQEAKLTKLAAVFVPSTASVTADNSGQSTQAKPTPLAGALQGDLPAVAQPQPGAWDYTKTRNALVQKYSRPIKE